MRLYGITSFSSGSPLFVNISVKYTSFLYRRAHYNSDWLLYYLQVTLIPFRKCCFSWIIILALLANRIEPNERLYLVASHLDLHCL